LAVHVACNHVAAAGVAPRWLLLLVLVPRLEDEELLGQIMQDASRGTSTRSRSQRGATPAAATWLQATWTANQPISPMAPTIGSTWETRISSPTLVRATSSPKAAPRMMSGSSVWAKGKTLLCNTSSENLHHAPPLGRPSLLR
jgi:hypothetical protein